MSRSPGHRTGLCNLLSLPHIPTLLYVDLWTGSRGLVRNREVVEVVDCMCRLDRYEIVVGDDQRLDGSDDILFFLLYRS